MKLPHSTLPHFFSAPWLAVDTGPILTQLPALTHGCSQGPEAVVLSAICRTQGQASLMVKQEGPMDGQLRVLPYVLECGLIQPDLTSLLCKTLE